MLLDTPVELTRLPSALDFLWLELGQPKYRHLSWEALEVPGLLCADSDRKPFVLSQFLKLSSDLALRQPWPSAQIPQTGAAGHPHKKAGSPHPQAWPVINTTCRWPM